MMTGTEEDVAKEGIVEEDVVEENHPFLFGEPSDESGQPICDSRPDLLISASGKFKVLDTMLRHLKMSGHQVKPTKEGPKKKRPSWQARQTAWCPLVFRASPQMPHRQKECPCVWAS